MTVLTIRRENLLAAIVGQKFRRLLAASRTRHCFLCRRRRAHRVEPATAEVARVTAEIRATKKNRQSVDRDEPNRERLGTDARFAFFTLNSSVHLLDVGLFAVIHSLAYARRLFRSFVHCVFILLAREIQRLADLVLQLVIPRPAVHLRQTWLLLVDAIG